MHSPIPLLRSSALPTAALLLIIGRSVAAQTPPASAGAPARAEDAPAIQLTPFTVDASRDVGYVAGNTLAGSRLNTSLKDTAASISVLTEEFLADIGALTVEDAMAYANNLQVDQEETTTSMTGNLVAESFTTYRVRGMKASVARNYFVWNVPGSTYNIERIDESRGPNSVLFGLGSAGGIINSSTKQALFNRPRRSASVVAGSFDTYRGTLDVNQPLVQDRLALRLNGLWSQRNTSREYSEAREQRGHLALGYRPFAGTQIRAEAERGQLRDHVTRGWTMLDQVSLWNSRGRPVRAAQAAVAADGIARLNATTARVTWIENDNRFVDLRGTMTSTVPAAQQNTMIIDPAIVDYSVNSAGPGAQRDTRFTTYTAVVEQKLPRHSFVSLAYNHQHYDFVGYDPSEGTSNTLFGDPNQTLPTSATATQPNPYAGRYFVETNWYRRNRRERFDTLRLTFSNEFDLQRWGNYRWAALAEQEWSNFARDERRESWVGAPFNATPENAANNVWRRYYITEGDWGSYRVPGAVDNLIASRTDPFTGRTLTSAWVQRNANIDDDNQHLRSGMLGGQARYFGGRLVGTFGFRRDEVRLEDRGTTRDPATNEMIVDYGTVSRFTDVAKTRTLGAVWHVTPALSLTYNKSTNNSLPAGAHRVLPNSQRPQQGRGEGEDIGVGLDLLGGKVHARATYFTTVGQNETDFRSVISIVTNRNIRILDTLVNAGQLAAAQADPRRVNVNGGYSDRESEGWELRLVANPAKSWRLQLNYSLTDAIESNIIPEVRAWAEEAIAFWRGFNTSLPTSAQPSIAQEIANLQDEIDAQTAADGVGAIGNRRHKASFFTRYDLPWAATKGLYVGGGYRYQSQMLIGRDAAGRKQYSASLARADLLLGYRFRLFGERHPAHVQLNIENLFDDTDPMILRRTPDNVYVRRFTVQEPRTYRLSLQLGF